jgi:hypothetical protein
VIGCSSLHLAFVDPHPFVIGVETRGDQQARQFPIDRDNAQRGAAGDGKPSRWPGNFCERDNIVPFAKMASKGDDMLDARAAPVLASLRYDNATYDNCGATSAQIHRLSLVKLSVCLGGIIAA